MTRCFQQNNFVSIASLFPEILQIIAVTYGSNAVLYGKSRLLRYVLAQFTQNDFHLDFRAFSSLHSVKVKIKVKIVFSKLIHNVP